MAIFGAPVARGVDPTRGAELPWPCRALWRNFLGSGGAGAGDVAQDYRMRDSLRPLVVAGALGSDAPWLMGQEGIP